ncbi:MAG: ParB/RepB/Spo0J family partition protein [Chloroflexota bacterium]
MSTSTGSGKRSGLGRGLGALITKTDIDGAVTSSEPREATDGIKTIPIDTIVPNPHQPRTRFDTAALEELAASVNEHGIIQPLIVTKAVDAEEIDRYWLVAGERRWRAAQLAQLSHVPVIVREASARQLMELALVENIQREDLNPLEEAAAYQSLMDEYNLTQAEVAGRVGKSRSAVANIVRLLQLPPDGQAALLAQEISSGHARALLSLNDEDTINKALPLIIEGELSVRQTEVLVKKLAEPTMAGLEEPPPPPDPMAGHWRSLEDRFRNALGTRVSLNRNDDGTGRLVVHFYSDDDLDSLLQQLATEEE